MCNRQVSDERYLGEDLGYHFMLRFIFQYVELDIAAA